MPIDIVPITQADAAAFWECLDTIARERRFLAFTQAPPLEHTQTFIADGLRHGQPRVIAKTADRLIGFCDIVPLRPDTLHHRGSLGMGVLAEFRGQGIGRRLLEGCLALARQAGITEVELEVRSDNERALRLYRAMGFAYEGIKPRGMRIDGHYLETTAMALLL